MGGMHWQGGTSGALLVAGLLLEPGAAQAQDAVRGAQLYLQLPAGLPSCVSCHGPDPSANRNNLLNAADRPATLLKALNAIGVMGYLKPTLSDVDVADLAAYLGRVLLVADPAAAVSLWPTTLEFGALALGAASPEHHVGLRNMSAVPMALTGLQLVGSGHRLQTDCPAQLAPAASCHITVHAIADAIGPRAATLSIEAGGVGSPLLIGVSSVVRDGAVGTLSTVAALDFGSVGVGDQSVREVLLASHGSMAVTLGVSTLTGPDRGQFRIEGGCASGSVLEPGSACTARVIYRPGAARVAQAALQWRSSGGNPGVVSLTGAGVVASAPVPAPPPAPSPAPAPVPEATATSAGGGGCSIAHARRPIDPMLLLLSAAALVVIAWRRLVVARTRESSDR